MKLSLLGSATLLVIAAVASISPAPGHASTTFTDVEDFASDPAFAAYYQQRVEFRSDTCLEHLQERFECAVVKTPKNWHEAAAGSLTLKMARAKVARPDGKRLLLSNPGGPGGSGQEFGAESVPELLRTHATHYAIGLDPRGVGESSPLSCVPPENEPDFETDGDASDFTRAQYEAGLRNRARFLKKCVTQEAASSINTEQTARDFNFVRHLLGYQQADYYGISYGTLLGSIAAKLFPHRFDRVLLDGNVDWQAPNWDESAISQTKGYQSVMDRQLLTWIARHHDAFGLGTSPAAVDATLVRVLRKNYDPEKFNTPEFFYFASRSALLRPDGFGGMASAIYAIKSIVDGTPLPPSSSAKAKLEQLKAQFRQHRGDENNPTFPVNPAHFAITCGDVAGTQDAAAWLRSYESLNKTFHLAGSNTVIPYCYGFVPYKAALTADIVNRPTKQILMLQQEADPATPYWGAYHALTRSNRATTKMVLVDDLPPHGASYVENSCARASVGGYMLEGKFPATDIVCQAAPMAETWADDRGEYRTITETVAYEFGNAGEGTQLPRPSLYAMRDFRAQQSDTTMSPLTRTASTRRELPAATLKALDKIADAAAFTRR